MPFHGKVPQASEPQANQHTEADGGTAVLYCAVVQARFRGGFAPVAYCERYPDAMLQSEGVRRSHR
jgi:hypothetical protein